MTGLDPVAPAITVDGAPLPNNWLDLLVGMRLERAIGMVGRGTLRFVDPGYALSAGGPFGVGAQVRISLHGGGLLMNAAVTAVSLEQSAGDHPELVVVIDDIARKLTRGTCVKTYAQVTWSDVIRTIASRSGLKTVVAATAGVQEYVLQAGSDLAVLDSIAERAGLMWWVDGAGGDELHVDKAGKSNGSVALQLTEDLLTFSVRASGLHPTEVNVQGWDADRQQALQAQRPVKASATARSDFVNAFVVPEKQLGSAAVVVSGQSVQTGADATAVASSLEESWATAAVVARGSCHVNAAIKPTVALTIKQAGPASGSYRVSQVEHVYSQRGFHTRFVAGDSRPPSLVGSLTAPRKDAGFLVPGLLIGQVTNINDPDSLGRVKVKYPGISDEVESTWARIATLGAGPSRGMVFQPEVNDEVLVGFEAGDSRRPLVLGGLYSKVNKLDSWGVKQGKVASRRITSRTGNFVELADAAGSDVDHILLQLAGGKGTVLLGADKLDVEVPQGNPVTIKAGQAKFEIAKDGSVTIEGTNVTIKAKAKVNIEGTGGLSAKSSAITAVEGMQVQVKGQAMASVEGGGQLALKGGMVAIN